MKLTQVIALFISVLASAAHSQDTGNHESFNVVVGAQRDSDIFPCNDYASYTTYFGSMYMVTVPENKQFGIKARTILRHEGMDFCTNTGAEVLVPANSTVIYFEKENSFDGGNVVLETSIKFNYNTHLGTERRTLYLFLTHLKLKTDIKIGEKLRAGEVLGVTEPPGKSGIGPKPHVHLQAHPISKIWLAHTDPNQFWQKGPGIVSCFDAKNPPSDQQMVAPLKCK
jgi:murein DD-endopeptidase MepM/ murein hydrolase activator NlpD